MLKVVHVHACTTHTHRSDSEHFGLAPPEFLAVQELEADITKHEQMWSLYEEFINGLETLSKEDWISFR